ncbi:MAG: hypothetical protein M3486_04790 [Actinomycetota bacterium]|nr:hypothetical protein [Actinomycetota bacterium]
MSMQTQLDRDVRVSRRSFDEATAQLGVPTEVQEALWARLSGRPTSAGLGLQSVVWYGGAAVSLVAMGLFLGTSWATVGSGTGLLLCLTYLGVFLGVCETLRGRGHRVPAGLLAATVVALVPLTVFAAQESFSLWSERSYGEYESFFDYCSGQWAFMEIATLAVSVGVWHRYRAPFLLLPTAIAGWFATMDFASAVGGEAGGAPVSALATAVLLSIGVLLDLRGLRGEGFWLHLSGLASLAWTLGRVDVDTGGRMLLVGLAGVAVVAAGVYLERRVQLSFGALFIFTALSHLAFEVFGGSPMFALSLGAVGVLIVVGGISLDRSGRSDSSSLRIT